MRNRAFFAVVAIGAAASIAQALPAGDMGGVHRSIVEAATQVETVASRRCARGSKRCRVQRAHRAYRPAAERRAASEETDYYVNDSRELPFGTKRWWEQMIRESGGPMP